MTCDSVGWAQPVREVVQWSKTCQSIGQKQWVGGVYMRREWRGNGSSEQAVVR